MVAFGYEYSDVSFLSIGILRSVFSATASCLLGVFYAVDLFYFYH